METFDFGEPLPKISCTSTKCEDDKHCFRPKRAKASTLEGGRCHACDADLVDWEKVQRMDIQEISSVTQFLKKEYIRHAFWNIQLDQELIKKNILKGRVKLEQQVVSRLKSSVKCAGEKNNWDGRQTPMKKKHLIYYAQHATATCCRKCIKYWHGIPYDRDLTDKEIEYLKSLIMYYLEERLSVLPEGKNLQTIIGFNGKKL